MKLMILPEGGRPPISVELGRVALLGTALAGAVLVASSVLGGYKVGQAAAESPPRLVAPGAGLDQVPERRGQLDALRDRLGELRADLSRLEVLGSQLVQEIGLDQAEFELADGSGQGGPYQPIADEQPDVAGLAEATEALAGQVQDREARYRALAAQLERRELVDRTRPEGWPVDHAWLSSGYGERTDPMTGHRAFHNGIDFASIDGEDVVATGEGVVVFSGWKPGYGHAVEVAHGNGYRTLYGHNKENVVQVGDRVNRGDVLARIGNTGRSTGPHVHFEVHRDGEPVDPYQFVNREP